MHDFIFFRHYFDLLAIIGGASEWLVLWWILAGWDVSPPAWAHVVVPVALAVLNRLATRRLEEEASHGPLSGTTGQVIVAAALAAVIGVGALAGTAVLSVGVQTFSGFRAEAGVLAAGTSGALLGLEFRLLGSLALGLTASAVAYGYLRGHRELVVTDVDVPVAGLPPALHGFTIAQVSDLHLGPIAHLGAVREALAQVVALEPDVICVTGDIVDSKATDLAKWLPEMDVLSARHGVFAILGNHDARVGFAHVADAITRWTRCRVLRDERATLDVGGARLHVVGIEHQAAADSAAALDRVLADVPAGEPVLCLLHHPKHFALTAARGVDLTLSGHTHGGQIAVPGVPKLNIARLLISRYDAGTYADGDSVLHVNRGLGTSGQRVRFGAPREITVLRLVPADPA